jgi:hypothetical protein
MLFIPFMPVVEPTEHDTPLTLVTSGRILYRGFSNRDEYERVQKRGFTPLVPLDTDPDWLGAREGTIETLQQVLEHRRDLVSFSLQKRVACFYATSREDRPYSNSGWIAEVRIPTIKNAYATPANPCLPYAYVAEDPSSSWIDPRHLPLSGEEMCHFDEWVKMRKRARDDDELLLVQGVVYPARPIYRVTPKDCDLSFQPCKDWGEKIQVE